MRKDLIDDNKKRGSDPIQFTGNVTSLTLGAVLSTGLLLLAEPLIARLFPPHAFGQAATFIACSTTLGYVSCLRYEAAVVLPKKDIKAAAIFVGSFLILCLITLILFLLFIIIGDKLLLILRINNGSMFLIILFPVFTFLAGFELLLRRWFTRFQEFKTIAASRMTMAAPRLILELTCGFLGYTSGANLITFRTAGFSGSPLFLLLQLTRKKFRWLIFSVTGNSISEQLRRYRNFPLFESWSHFLIILSWYSPVIFLAILFDPQEAGLFAKALFLLYLPIQLIGESVDQAFLQASAADKAESKDISGLTEGVLKRMIGIALLPFVFVAVTGQDLFYLVLGGNWGEAGIYAALICPWLFVHFVGSPVVTLFGTLGQQKAGALSNFVLVFLRIGSLVIGKLVFNNPYWSIALFSAVSVLVMVLRSFYLLKIIKVHIRPVLLQFGRCIILVIPLLIAVLISSLFTSITNSSLLIIGITTIVSIPYIYFIIGKDLILLKKLLKK